MRARGRRVDEIINQRIKGQETPIAAPQEFSTLDDVANDIEGLFRSALLQCNLSRRNPTA